MTLETHRIADQLRRAFSGGAPDERHILEPQVPEPWYGPSLRQALAGITPEQAHARPVPSAHSIWELVLHIEAWLTVAQAAADSGPIPSIFRTPRDWPSPPDPSESTLTELLTESLWTDSLSQLFETADRLARAIEQFPETHLQRPVPGRDFTFYHLFHGVVQHSIYHAGQIVLLHLATD